MLEGDTGVNRDPVRVRKATISASYIVVATSAIRFVTDGFSELFGCTVSLCSVWRAIHVGQKRARLLLLPSSMHGAIATVIVVNVGISPSSIDLVSKAGPIIREVGN